MAGPARGGRKAPQPSIVEEDLLTEDEMAEFDADVDLGDKLSLDPRIKADADARGMVIQWKRLTYVGMPDTEYQSYLARRKWEAIPAGRYKAYGFCMPGTAPDDPIVRGGQILMERPLKYQQYAEMNERKLAAGQVAEKEQQLYATPDGHFERNVKVTKEYAPIAGAVVGRGARAVALDD